MKTVSNIEDIWVWNQVTSYQSVLLKDILSPEKTVLQVQKITLKFIDIILEQWFWIEKKVSKLFWRSWVIQLSLKEYWDIIMITSKWTDSLNAFSNISDFYLWWSDIVEKMNAIRKNTLKKITQTPGEVLWKYKTELLLLIWSDSIQKNTDLNTLQIQKLYTKFSPILTQYNISKLPLKYIKPEILETDSNSELAVQIWESEWNISWAVEIIQSWKSAVSTNNYIVRNEKIYEPSTRCPDTGSFTWNIIWKLEPESQIWMIAKRIQTEINIDLCKFNKVKYNKNEYFIEKFKNTMKEIK